MDFFNIWKRTGYPPTHKDLCPHAPVCSQGRHTRISCAAAIRIYFYPQDPFNTESVGFSHTDNQFSNSPDTNWVSKDSIQL